MKKPETIIQDKIIDYLNSQHIWNMRYQAVVNRYGVPDIIAIYKGYFVGLEVKTEIGRPTALQLRVIQSIENAGGFAEIVTSVSDVQRLLFKIDRA